MNSKMMFDIQNISTWNLFDSGEPYIIAGPCSAESYEQLKNTAVLLQKKKVGLFRAGLWKPRTHPGFFEGVGEKGIEWMKNIKAETGMKICTEVACARHVELCSEAGFDLLWIGSRTTTNPFLVQELANALEGTDIPILVKNPFGQDLELWTGALERLAGAGVRKIGIIHRGFSSKNMTKYRNFPDWNLAIRMKSLFPEIPFFSDPSHIAGDRRFVKEIAEMSMNLGFDGLMIEVHVNPERALSDASQQLTPDELSEMLDSLHVRNKNSMSPDYVNNIEALRMQIDEIDETILHALSERAALSRKIGEYKKLHDITILQTERWERLMSEILSKSENCGLNKNFLRELFAVIHEESVRIQNEVISKK